MAENQKKRFCTNCGKQALGAERFCTNCGAELPPLELSNWEKMSGTIPTGNVSQPQGTPILPTAPKPKKKAFPVKIFGIGAAVILVFGIGAAVFSGTGEEGEVETEPVSPVVIETADNQETQTQPSEESEGKIEISAYDLYAALQENDIFTYTLNDKMTEFLQTHEELFPTVSEDEILAAGVVDETLEARQIMKNPDRYGDKLMFLPELQVVQIMESEVDEDQYMTEINAADWMEQSYYIIYNGVLDDVFEGDWIYAYGLPLGADTYENVSGGETWTIPMAGSFVEKLNADFTENAEEESVPEFTVQAEEYVLPTSDFAYLTDADVAGLSREQIRLAINEIYARHGRIFQTEDLNQYFSSKSWYVPLYTADEFTAMEEILLNDYERANIQFLAAIRDGNRG